MRKWTRILRVVAVLALLSFAQVLVLPQMVQAQTPECTYDKESPSLESARLNFRITNYDCAEMELNDLLADESLDLQAKADAHILLAAVYYAKVRDDKEKRSRVMEQFVAAFQSLRQWRGELDIKSPEFLALMKEAQELVDKQEKAADAVKEQIPEAKMEPLITQKPGEEKKPWYKRWWVLGIGVGVVATAVAVAAGGGGDDGGQPPDELPGFPVHP